MIRYGYLLTATTFAWALCACDNGDREVAHGASGTSAVNGSLHVPAGEHTGSVATVNGEVSIDANATVTTVHTVNGSIDLGAHSSATSVNAVNGRSPWARVRASRAGSRPSTAPSSWTRAWMSAGR